MTMRTETGMRRGPACCRCRRRCGCRAGSASAPASCGAASGSRRGGIVGGVGGIDSEIEESAGLHEVNAAAIARPVRLTAAEPTASAAAPTATATGRIVDSGVERSDACHPRRWYRCRDRRPRHPLPQRHLRRQRRDTCGHRAKAPRIARSPAGDFVEAAIHAVPFDLHCDIGGRAAPACTTAAVAPCSGGSAASACSSVLMS